MDELSLRLLFQERVALQRLLNSPRLSLDREELLGILSGEGSRLDSLIKAELLSVFQDRLQPGPLLINLIQFSGSNSKQISLSLWRLAFTQLTESVHTLPPVSQPEHRYIHGQRVFQLLLVLQSRAEGVYSAFKEGILQDVSADMLRTEFLDAAAYLRGVQIHSSRYPEWEETQWALISWLEGAGTSVTEADLSERERKLLDLEGLTNQQLLAQTNLAEILQKDHFLQIQEGIVVVPWPALPNASDKKLDPPIPSGEFIATMEDMEAWQRSGLHLMAWVESSTEGTEIMSEFSRLVATWADQITWKKNESGAFWEAWPVASS